jgi:cytochrome c
MRYSCLALAALLPCVVATGSAYAADASAGEEVAQRCAICHKFDKGTGNGVGPNLFGVVGRKAASLPDFTYSDALKASNITWTTDNITKWLADPTKMVPGTKMITPPGVISQLSNEDIANLIAYLQTLK